MYGFSQSLASCFLDFVPSLRNNTIMHGHVSLTWLFELYDPHKMSMPVYCDYMENSLAVGGKRHPLKPLCGGWKRDRPVLQNM